MPTGSSILEFEDAIRTGTTKTTKALEELCRTQGAALRPKLAATDALDGLPPWLKTKLESQGAAREDLELITKELNHIRDWPNRPDKRRIRVALRSAIANGQTVLFRWELSSGSGPTTDVPSLPLPPGPITITFRNPRGKIRVRGSQPAPNDVTVIVP